MAIAVSTGPNVSAAIGPKNVWEPSDVTPAPDVLNNRLVLSCQAAVVKRRAGALIICRHGIAEDIATRRQIIVELCEIDVQRYYVTSGANAAGIGDHV